MSFQIKHSTLLNLKRKGEQDKKSNNDIINSHYFLRPGDDDEFENELKKDLFKESRHVKTDGPYVASTVQDVEKIENKKQKKDDEFLKLALKFNKLIQVL